MDYRELVFVYRTDANPVSLAAEFAREVLGNDRHLCTLCHLTYGRVVKRPEWRQFIGQLDIDASFHLRSRFLAKHPALRGSEFPAVFIADSTGDLSVFLSADELATATTLEELIDMVDGRMRELT